MSGEVVMKKKLSVIILLSMALSLFARNAFSWNPTSHSQMTFDAVENVPVVYPTANQPATNPLSVRLSNLLGFPIDDINQVFQGPDSWGSTDLAWTRNFTALGWLTQGSENEDGYFFWQLATHYMKSVNHFYNPFWDNSILYPYHDDGRFGGRDWYPQQGGLSDSLATGIASVDLWTGKPSPNWAYDGCPTLPPNSDFSGSDYFSWTYAKKYYYAALTGDGTQLPSLLTSGQGLAPPWITGGTNMSEQDRSTCFALLFRSLGQIMHLIQDSGNPEHTRNQAHPLSGEIGFEKYVEEVYDFRGVPVPAIPWNKIVKSDTPIFDFFASDISGQSGYSPSSTGLAEFSNYNFFTFGSIYDNFMHDYCQPNCTPWGDERDRFFSHPQVNTSSGTYEPGFIYDTYYYWSDPIVDPLGINSSQTFRTAKREWYHNLLLVYGWRDYTTEDDKIRNDYINILGPRSVAYSAAALDYFFRGAIDVQPSQNSGFYAIYNPKDHNYEDLSVAVFNQVKLSAKNISENGELMQDGTIQLVVKYKVAPSDPFTSGYFSRDDVPFSYAQAFESSGITAIPNDSYVDLTFNFPGGIPLWATDVYFYLVYKGPLGQGNSVEQNAVAVGFKDVSEPTPYAFVNNMDKVCINSTWYDADSTDAHAIADPKGWDVYPHRLGGFDVRFYTYGTPDVYPPPAHYSVDILPPPTVDPDKFFERVFIIGDGTSTVASNWDHGYVGYATSQIPVLHLSDPGPDNFLESYYPQWANPKSPNIRRQKTPYTDPDACAAYGLKPPCTLDWWPKFIQFRGKQFWGPDIYTLIYPYDGTPCDISQLQQ
jgi:hypothetical protein